MKEDWASVEPKGLEYLAWLTLTCTLISMNMVICVPESWMLKLQHFLGG